MVLTLWRQVLGSLGWHNAARKSEVPNGTKKWIRKPNWPEWSALPPDEDAAAKNVEMSGNYLMVELLW